MPDATPAGTAPAPRRRADARRNEQTLLDAAAAVFVDAGVDAPVRAIAARAGVGMGTIYRHFPTRADLIVAVYRHQVESLALAGPELLTASPSAHEALAAWIEGFVDFLVTKHGLAAAFQSDDDGFAALHHYFVDRLVPVLGKILDAGARDAQLRPGLDPLEVLRAVGSLCAGFPAAESATARRMVTLFVGGLRA